MVSLRARFVLSIITVENHFQHHLPIGFNHAFRWFYECNGDSLNSFQAFFNYHGLGSPSTFNPSIHQNQIQCLYPCFSTMKFTWWKFWTICWHLKNGELSSRFFTRFPSAFDQSAPSRGWSRPARPQRLSRATAWPTHLTFGERLDKKT